MSRPALRMTAAAPLSRRSGQMSRPRTFAPVRGLQMRPRLVLPALGREAAMRWWSGLMLRRCRSVRDGALRFDCTDQTVRNWMAGTSCPTGNAVLLAQLLWPDEFEALSHQFRGR